MTSTGPHADTSDREIRISRVFDAPRELVFDAWTDPARIGAWFGPRGFTTTTKRMAVEPGGEWVYVMHGPDGTDYDNWIRYHEVVRPERLVYDHGSTTDTPAHFHVTITFVERDGKTELTMRSVFPTAEARDLVVKRYGAVPGGRQTLDRLAEALGARPMEPTGKRDFRIVRAFAAPRELVFRAWTDPAQLARWWGPHGFTNPRCEFVARPGGAIHIDMGGPDGTTHPMTGTVEELAPPQRLVFTSAALDRAGQAAMRVRTTVTFAESGGLTTVTVDAHADDVTPLGAMFLAGMDEGWSQSLQRLDDELELAQIGPATPGVELATSRLLHASPAAVWRAWTDPQRLAAWWGPDGFTNTFHVCDVRPGGEWRHTMHGPNGTDYPNHSVFAELVPQRRIVIDHRSAPEFRLVASFSERHGETLITFRQRFADPAVCEKVRAVCEPCNEQNLDRLELVLATMP